MKPVLRALRGEPLWPPPVWLMRQAGRYLPEYRAIRAKAGDFITLCTTPTWATEITLQPIRRFGFDAAILFSDILLLPFVLGQHVEYRDGEGPVLTPLRDAAALHALDPARLAGGIEPVLETIRRVSAKLAAEHPDVTLIGFAGAPFTVASYMVEGGGSKDFAAARLLARQDPSLFDRLIDLLTATTIDYLRAQIEAGADVVMLFDSWAGILPPALFRQYVIAPSHQDRRRAEAAFPAASRHRVSTPRRPDAGGVCGECRAGWDRHRHQHGSGARRLHGADADGRARQSRPCGTACRR